MAESLRRALKEVLGVNGRSYSVSIVLGETRRRQQLATNGLKDKHGVMCGVGIWCRSMGLQRPTEVLLVVRTW